VRTRPACRMRGVLGRHGLLRPGQELKGRMRCPRSTATARAQRVPRDGPAEASRENSALTNCQ
jgi:hypothetical protein